MKKKNPDMKEFHQMIRLVSYMMMMMKYSYIDEITSRFLVYIISFSLYILYRNIENQRIGVFVLLVTEEKQTYFTDTY